jgi:dihydropteroate synthase
LTDPEAAVAQALRFQDEGADMVDIGGESTRPGAARVTPDEEMRRVLPVIERLRSQLDITISVDTSNSEVAKRALDLGAVVVNDVWALARDPQLGRIVAERDASVVLMHNRAAEAVSSPAGGHYPDDDWSRGDVVSAVLSSLVDSVTAAIEQGIPSENILIDPGIGFGKGVEQNLELLRRLREFKTHPDLRQFPLLLGTSRKSVIGLTLKLPPGDRLEGTLATLALGVASGADMVRVHDVRAAVRCCRMADAIVRGTTR